MNYSTIFTDTREHFHKYRMHTWGDQKLPDSCRVLVCFRIDACYITQHTYPRTQNTSCFALPLTLCSLLDTLNASAHLALVQILPELPSVPLSSPCELVSVNKTSITVLPNTIAQQNMKIIKKVSMESSVGWWENRWHRQHTHHVHGCFYFQQRFKICRSASSRKSKQEQKFQGNQQLLNDIFKFKTNGHIINIRILKIINFYFTPSKNI